MIGIVGGGLAGTALAKWLWENDKKFLWIKNDVPAASAKSSTESIYSVNQEATSVQWTAKKVGGSHNGKIKVQNGTLKFSNGKLVGGNIVIDMNSMTCDDISNAEYNAKLIGHLKNQDFFNTEMHPHATLDITKVTSTGEGKMKVTANLAIKGISKAITFDVTTTTEGDVVKATAKIVFDRTKYDVKYGSGLIGTAQDKLIYDDVTLDINLVADKK